MVGYEVEKPSVPDVNASGLKIDHDSGQITVDAKFTRMDDDRKIILREKNEYRTAFFFLSDWC